MIDALNSRGQKCLVVIVQWALGTSASKEIADIFHNYNNDKTVLRPSYLFMIEIPIQGKTVFLLRRGTSHRERSLFKSPPSQMYYTFYVNVHTIHYVVMLP